MKALTICQPYASLIVGGPGVDAAQLKRVENRSWPTWHRGPLLIHAGKSRAWLDTWRGPYPASMPFGALIGVVEIYGCMQLDTIRWLPYDNELAWLKRHQHTEGPWCWLLRNPRRFDDPIECRGRQGLFEVDDELLPEDMR